MLLKILTPILFAHFVFTFYAGKTTEPVNTEHLDKKEVKNEMSKPLNSFPARINNMLQHQELKEVLFSLVKVNKGKFISISDSFSSTNNDWYWTIKEGQLPENIVGQTNYEGNCVITTLDYSKLVNATNLFVASNILHEMAHAYLTLYYRFNPFAARKDYPTIYSDWLAQKGFNYNDAQHAEMEMHFKEDIMYSLKAYCETNHLAENDLILSDLAWGGLDFTNSIHLLETDKERIQNRLQSELNNRHKGHEYPCGSIHSLDDSRRKEANVIKENY